MNRRDFLHPRHWTQSAGQVLGALDLLSSPPALRRHENVCFLRAERRAMATSFQIFLPTRYQLGLKACEAAFDLIDRIEKQLTVFRDDSEVSRLNQRAGREEVPVSNSLFQLLTLAQTLSAETMGAFDITTGALTKAWGFYRRAGKVPPPEERQSALSRTGMSFVRLDPAKRTVRFERSGLELNFGSIGKGYALDKAARLLRQHWKISSGLLHGGRSSVYAIGNGPGDQRGWEVGIQHPWRPGERLAVVRLRQRALATSSATYQHVEFQGRKLGHLLDPRTGWPAEGMQSASALAPTAAEADALATAFFILGVDETKKYCEQHPAIGAVLLPEGETRPIFVGNIESFKRRIS
ncbi:MAG: FAD:protein FMN transferase [Gemmatales bacterium]|nr:MAG: FAD:protein FMN transferase [Gemmatales bacterium]